jgi:hypothetical protein
MKTHRLALVAVCCMLGVARAEDQPKPPAPPANSGCPSAEYDQLDFWLGRWTVHTTTGNHAGDSEITSLAQDCIVFESWTGASGVSGNSINVYDQADGKWHQTWVDSTGDQVHFVGAFEDGKMSLASEDVSTPDRTKTLVRMTLEPTADGKVKQVGTQSSDGGKTWKTTYELIYTRKP